MPTTIDQYILASQIVDAQFLEVLLQSRPIQITAILYFYFFIFLICLINDQQHMDY